MGNFINAGRQKRIKLAYDLIEKVEKGEDIEITLLTGAVSELLNKYHNQKCSPDENWINREETEALHKLLGMLSQGIKQLEDI